MSTAMQPVNGKRPWRAPRIVEVVLPPKRFPITFFRDHAAREKTEEVLSLEELARRIETTSKPHKEELPWLKAARFGNKKSPNGSLRWNSNVDVITGAVADYDGEVMTIEEAAGKLGGIAGMVYTSPSHRLNGHGPRFRVVCPFSKRLNGLFGGVLAEESFTLSQAYYFGSVDGNPMHKVIVVAGTTTIDLCRELDDTAIGKPAREHQLPPEEDPPEAPIEDIRAALDAIPNPIPTWEPDRPTWVEWNKMGMAVWRASGGSDEGREAFDGWSAKWPKKHDADDVRFHWNCYRKSPPTATGFGKLAKLAGEAVPGWTPPSRGRHGLPRIRVRAGERHEAADAGLAAMIQAGIPFYQRDQKLVRVARLEMKARSGATIPVPGIVQVTAPLLMRELGRSAQWLKYNERKKNWLPCDPPDPVAQQILSMVGEWPFSPIRGVIGTQTMRPDGTLLTEPGYDAKTGFVLFEPPTMPTIPTMPSKDDALRALKFLDALFDEFPFPQGDDASRSVALSLDMSLILRPAMSVVPLHVVNAPEGGTGKSFLFDIASLHALGEECPVLGRGATYEETEKRLIGAAVEGRPLIVLDNCNGELRSEFLCQAVERPIIKPRPLGTTVMPSIPNSFVCGANGNNIEIADDLVRRTLQCSLDANMEEPYLREFKNNPRHSVTDDRGRYVAAVLTIARAYTAAGRPPMGLKPLASFEEWSALVRGALVWLGRADPVDTMKRLAAADPVRDVMAEVFEALATTFLLGFTVADIMRASKENIQLRALMLKATKRKSQDDEINAESMGWWLRRNKGRIAGSRKLVLDPGGRSKKWWEIQDLRPLPLLTENGPPTATRAYRF